MKREEAINRIPLDIESILEIGIDKWYDSFEWPFSWAEFVKLEDEVKSILKYHIENTPEYADIIVINYKIYIEFANFILALILKEKIGANALISDNNLYYKSIFDSGVPDRPLVNFPNLNQKNVLRRKIKWIKRFLKDNDFSFPRLFEKDVFILSESRSHQTLDYLQKHHLGNIYALSFFDYYSEKTRLPLPQKNKMEIEELSLSIKEDLVHLIQSYGIYTTRIQEEFIVNYINKMFEETIVTLNTIEKNLNGKKIKLYIGSNNNHFSRIISVAIRNAGGEIHGFSHGEPINYENDLVSWLDLSLNDYYYEYTETNAEILRDIADKFPALKANKCNIKSMENPQYSGLWDENSIKSIEEVSNVMIIGNCFRHSSFSTATSVFPTLQLFVELSLIKELRNMGYSVIYKLHPDNLDKRIGFVKNINVFRSLLPDDIEIDKGKFEDSLENVDVFVFYYTATSTFGPAIQSKKPVFFYDLKLRQYSPKTFDLLIRRCEYHQFNNKYISCVE